MKTLLLLEDEPSVLKLLRRMLKQYNLVEATSAGQALQLFRERDPQIDLLIADLTLPTSSGILVALELRAEIPDLPVILTSGYPACDWSDEDAAGLERLGSNAVEILQKPFQTPMLLEAVCHLTGTNGVQSASHSN